jgi:UDP-N-acetylglucosamine/UDP-N-acetylgalactosamine diphosphorylase
MDRSLDRKVEVLRGQGVILPSPQTLEIGEEVPLDQIRGPDTVIHGGTKLYGDRLMILSGARIGYEEPATVENCAVGRRVRLSGGYFADAVFLDDVVMGKGAHVRTGTLMEEEANGAHTVGLKQTILLPFVTIGSLVNFCDVLMAGGTSRRDHSEVGSSFIHFNFTPFGRSGDKATPTLIGDVPRGVMLRSARIFLGGQGGLVGPMQIDYGTVLAAGFVYRRDHGPDQLVVGEKLPARTMPFHPLRYSRIRTRVKKNLTYIGNLVALWHWYEHVRSSIAVAASDDGLVSLYRRAQGVVEQGIEERIKRLGQVAGYMEDSARELESEGVKSGGGEIAAQRSFTSSWPELERKLNTYQENTGAPKRLMEEIGSGSPYLEIIRGLGPEAVAAGTSWLAGIVTAVEDLY